MSWIVGIVIAAGVLYFLLFHKPRPPALVMRVETSVPSDSSHTDRDEPEGDEKDNWESFDFYRAKMLPAKGQYRINYEDQRGLKTERQIQVKRVHECEGKYAIDAHCFLRNAHRSFVGERIAKAINVDSGEVVADVAQDAIAQYNDSGEGRALLAIGREWMGVAVLAFVCRADGKMYKVEREVIADYLKRHCPDLSLGDAELDSAIKAVGEPDHKEFKRIIRDLRTAGERDRLSDLLACSRRIVGTQKTVAPMEKAALEILEQAAS